MAWRSAHTDAPTVFLVDGWITFRRSLRLFLEAAGYRVAGEADTADLAAAMDGVRDADIVVLDPRPDWLDLEGDLAKLRRAAPGAGVVLLGSVPIPARLVFRAVESGISAYLTKGNDPADLLRAMEAALSKELVLLPRRLLPKAAARLAGIKTFSAEARVAGHPRLTRRELEILSLAASSYSNRQIARALWVTDQTVRFHLDNTYRKLGVKTRAAAIAAARRLGLLGWEGGQGPELV